MQENGTLASLQSEYINVPDSPCDWFYDVSTPNEQTPIGWPEIYGLWWILGGTALLAFIWMAGKLAWRARVQGQLKPSAPPANMQQSEEREEPQEQQVGIPVIWRHTAAEEAPPQRARGGSTTSRRPRYFMARIQGALLLSNRASAGGSESSRGRLISSDRLISPSVLSATNKTMADLLTMCRRLCDEHEELRREHRELRRKYEGLIASMVGAVEERGYEDEDGTAVIDSNLKTGDIHQNY